MEINIFGLHYSSSSSSSSTVNSQRMSNFPLLTMGQTNLDDALWSSKKKAQKETGVGFPENVRKISKLLPAIPNEKEQAAFLTKICCNLVTNHA